MILRAQAGPGLSPLGLAVIEESPTGASYRDQTLTSAAGSEANFRGRQVDAGTL